MKSPNFPNDLVPPIWQILAVVWIVAASVLTSHFRLYYGADWSNAVKWGIGDGFVWSILAVFAVWVYSAHIAHSEEELLRRLFLCGAVFAGVIMHPLLVVLLYAALDGPASRPIIEDVIHLVGKRFPQGALAGLLLGLVSRKFVDSCRRRTAKPEQSASTQISRAVRDESWLWVTGADGAVRIHLSDILYIEAAGNYVAIFANGVEHLDRGTMKAMEQKLCQRRFLRISRKHLVNLGRVSAIQSVKPNSSVVVMEGGRRLPVGRQYKSRLQQAISNERQLH